METLAILIILLQPGTRNTCQNLWNDLSLATSHVTESHCHSNISEINARLEDILVRDSWIKQQGFFMGGALVSLQGSLTLIAIKRKVNKKQNSFYSMAILRLSVTQTNIKLSS